MFLSFSVSTGEKLNVFLIGIMTEVLTWPLEFSLKNNNKKSINHKHKSKNNSVLRQCSCRS